MAQCMKEMEETQARAREEMAAMLAENEDLKPSRLSAAGCNSKRCHPAR